MVHLQWTYIFTSSEKDTILSIPTFQLTHWKAPKEQLPVKADTQKIVEYLSLFLDHCYQHIHQWEYSFMDLYFLFDVPVEAFLFPCCIPCQVHFPSLHSLAASPYSSHSTCSYFLCLCISFLLQFDQHVSLRWLLQWYGCFYLWCCHGPFMSYYQSPEADYASFCAFTFNRMTDTNTGN